MRKVLLCSIVLMGFLEAFLVAGKPHHATVTVTQTQTESPPPPPARPEKYEVSAMPQEYLNYTQVQALLEKWNKECPEITELGEYGKTVSGTPLKYLRVGTPGQPKVLIHACIHGNERLAAAATLWMMQKMLNDFGRDPNITWLVQNREVYWVPVLSPDTYLKQRFVEGVDPNRDYPYPGRKDHKAASPIQAIMDFHMKHHFTGVISGHTTGNVYFWPAIAPAADQTLHKQLAGEMSKLSGYNNSRISGGPAGFEIDWYYWKGAVAILTEFGSGSHEQPTSSIKPHGDKNYPAYMHFIKQSPDLQKNLNPPK